MDEHYMKGGGSNLFDARPVQMRPGLLIPKVAGLLAFFPFFSPYPIQTDIQPTFFFLAFFCLIAKKVNLDWRPILILLPMTLLSLVYFSSIENWTGSEFLRFSFSIIAFAFFMNFRSTVTARLVFVACVGNFMFLVFHFFAPDFFVSLFEPFVRTIKIDTIGIRGASGLAPEPGLAGSVMVSILAIAAFRKEFYNDEFYYSLVVVMVVLGVFMTRSGTGTLYLVLFFLLHFFNFKRLGVLLLILGLAYIVITYVDFGRGGDSVRLLISSPATALQQDASIGARALNFLVGWFAIFERPLGFGFDSYVVPASTIVESNNLYSVAVGNIGRLSAFSTYSVLAGLVWWATLAALFFPCLRALGKRSAPFVAVAGLLISFSVSVAFPLTWMFLGLCNRVPKSQVVWQKAV